jgi:hypothetical protein
MGVPNQVLGLRERKKIQTRETIQREAYRLFDVNGPEGRKQTSPELALLGR